MSGEVVELEKTNSGLFVPVTQRSVEELQKQRALLKSFISSQLLEANFKDKSAADYGLGDYGVIPGTKQNCLFKPGAEKLRMLFNLGVRMEKTGSEIDRHANFAMFDYKAVVYPINNQSLVLAECEASCNSQEKKYRERTVWRNNVSSIEETPIFDILNTLKKMAQKRAFVGAIILATGASDYFTQDMLEPEDIQEMVKPHDSGKPAEKPVKADLVQEKAPVCCGREMMVSKYANKETGNFDWYCTGCKKPRERTA